MVALAAGAQGQKQFLALRVAEGQGAAESVFQIGYIDGVPIRRLCWNG